MVAAGWDALAGGDSMSMKTIGRMAVAVWWLICLFWLVLLVSTQDCRFGQKAIDAAQWATITYLLFRPWLYPGDGRK
jgi:hypothetical protein